MSTETTKDTLPFTCTPAYDRDACKGVSFLPAMNRNFVTGAAPVQSRDIGKNDAMLMREPTITNKKRI